MSLRVVVTASFLGGMMLAVVGCGSSLPRPPDGPQPPEAFAEVPYPPPPARVEILPDRPNENALWLDGRWSWVGRRWFWEPGGWVIPEPKTYFARWVLERRADGRLYFAPGRWRWTEGGAEAPEPEIIESSVARPGRKKDEKNEKPVTDGGTTP